MKKRLQTDIFSHIMDLIKALSSEYFFDVVEFLQTNPDQNATFIAKKLKIHVATTQKILDTLEKHELISSKEKRSIGRPSKIYTYIGGRINFDLDDMLSVYKQRFTKIRESGNQEISFSYDIDKEIVNAVLIKGKTGKKEKIDTRMGRLLWLVPPPDSDGSTIEALSKEAKVSAIDAVDFVHHMIELNVIEEAT